MRDNNRITKKELGMALIEIDEDKFGRMYLINYYVGCADITSKVPLANQVYNSLRKAGYNINLKEIREVIRL